MSKTAIKICPKCSGIKGKHLKEVLTKDDYSCGCFGKCLKKNPELEGKAYARINGKLVACDSRKKLIKKMVAAVAYGIITERNSAYAPLFGRVGLSGRPDCAIADGARGYVDRVERLFPWVYWTLCINLS